MSVRHPALRDARRLICLVACLTTVVLVAGCRGGGLPEPTPLQSAEGASTEAPEGDDEGPAPENAAGEGDGNPSSDDGAAGDDVTTVVRGPEHYAHYPPSPNHTMFGLTLGVSDHDAIVAWMQERQLDCPGEPSPRRTSMRYACTGTQLRGAFPTREYGGVLYSMLLTRGDDDPLSHLSMTRRYSLAHAAIEDYNNTRTTLMETYGEPTRTRDTIGADALAEARLFRASTLWQFSDVTVELTLMKASENYISIAEKYTIPGASALQGARPGSAPAHGSTPRPATNPHVLQE